jgi:hypothetical protein
MAGIPGAAWGRNDLETTEHRYIMGGEKQGVPGCLPTCSVSS